LKGIALTAKSNRRNPMISKTIPKTLIQAENSTH